MDCIYCFCKVLVHCCPHGVRGAWRKHCSRWRVFFVHDFVWCVSVAMESVTDDNVKRASAWRVKYMKKDNMQILPSFLGFHPRNRDGLGPNAERCEQLFLEFLGQFDKVEANHDAVCVEKKPGCDSFLQFNKKACSGERGLADVGDELPYATLGHSHLN